MRTSRWRRFAERFAQYDFYFQVAFIVLMLGLSAVLAFIDYWRR
jgi:hypothetical protein